MSNIVNEIRNTFPVGKPPRSPITGHRCDECDEVDRLVGGRTWLEVADNFPQFAHDSFSLLTPEAKAYYLPAYMCFDVLSPQWEAGAGVFYAFERGDLTPEQFSDLQRAAIAGWIEHYHRSGAGGRAVTRTMRRLVEQLRRG